MNHDPDEITRPPPEAASACIDQAILLTPDFGVNPPFCFSARFAALVSAAS
jgi:hypothetical protein